MTLRPAPAVPCGAVRCSTQSTQPTQSTKSPQAQFIRTLARLLAPLVFIR
ncbi:hypothetical protein [Zemynaea arenosa]|nr:hypothetical protein [Massilia arenosa]